MFVCGRVLCLEMGCIEEKSWCEGDENVVGRDSIDLQYNCTLRYM